MSLRIEKPVYKVKMDGSNPHDFFKEIELSHEVEVCLTNNFVRKYCLLLNVPLEEQREIILDTIRNGTIYGNDHENGKENTFLIENEIHKNQITVGFPFAIDGKGNKLILITAKNTLTDKEYNDSKNVFYIESPYKDKEFEIENMDMLNSFMNVLKKV